MTDVLTRLRNALSGHYAVERELGQGGMATVYLATDVKHRRQVAIKVLAPDISRSVGPDRFLREIEIAAGLTHPHILPVFDSGDADGLLYYVMPFIAGESLRERLRRERALPVDDALRITREVAECARLRASPGLRAPRHQAGKHPARRRPRRRRRLWRRASARRGRRPQADGHRARHRDAAIHESRAVHR